MYQEVLNFINGWIGIISFVMTFATLIIAVRVNKKIKGRVERNKLNTYIKPWCKSLGGAVSSLTKDRMLPRETIIDCCMIVNSTYLRRCLFYKEYHSEIEMTKERLSACVLILDSGNALDSAIRLDLAQKLQRLKEQLEVEKDL